MPAQKGHPKVGGRKKGTPNKVTASLREWIAELINNNRKNIIKDLKNKDLTPAQRLAFFEKLLQYVIPKQQAAAVDLAHVTDEQLNEIINTITKDLD